MTTSELKRGRQAVTSKKPDVPEPDVAEPDVAEPDAVANDVAEPDAAVNDVPEPDVAANDVAEADASEPEVEKALDAERPARRVTISLRSLIAVGLIAAVVAGFGVLGWFYLGAQHKLDAQARQLENNSHAEKVALEYAVSAAAMNYQDINGWKVKLVAGTTPELKDKLTNAATSIEQILVPLQWTSTAKPLVAKVHSHTGEMYVVDAFVSVMTKTVQAPDPLQSTATYSVTLDSKDWKISDVGGIGVAVGDK
jgi:Mce-associated membrane protein